MCFLPWYRSSWMRALWSEIFRKQSVAPPPPPVLGASWALGQPRGWGWRRGPTRPMRKPNLPWVTQLGGDKAELQKDLSDSNTLSLATALSWPPVPATAPALQQLSLGTSKLALTHLVKQSKEHGHSPEIRATHREHRSKLTLRSCKARTRRSWMSPPFHHHLHE